MDAEALKRALNKAGSDILDISNIRPQYNRIILEKDYQDALYSILKNDYTLQVEAAYPPHPNQGRRKCDLRIVEAARETWIEMKCPTCSVLQGNDAILHNNNDDFDQWQADIDRLQTLPNNYQKLFLGIVLYDQWDENYLLVQNMRNSEYNFDEYYFGSFNWQNATMENPIEVHSKAFILEV